MNNIKSWRDIIKPHNDVAQGRYKNAEFAADLAQVARGEGSPEYQACRMWMARRNRSPARSWPSRPRWRCRGG